MAQTKTVTLHNALIEARYKLTAGEHRLLRYLLAELDSAAPELRPCRVSAYQVASLARHPEQLAQHTLAWTGTDGQPQASPWFASVRRHADGWELQFAPALAPYLLRLEHHCTAYPLDQVLGLGGRYAIRLYELLKQAEAAGRREFAVDDLRHILGAEAEYPALRDFKKRVLQPALKEINAKTGLACALGQRKEGRRVAALVFSVQPRSGPAALPPQRRRAKKSLPGGQGLEPGQSLLVTGAAASGKTRRLDALHQDAATLWAGRGTPLFLAASRSQAEWSHGPHLEAWWAARPDAATPWRKLKSFEKARLLPLYLQETRAVLFLDDADALSGHSQKGQLAQACLRAADLWVVAASDEGRLFPGLRQDVAGTVDSGAAQVVRLDSDVAYDATPVFLWGLLSLLLAMGYWELASVLGGLKMLGSGRRAARQA